MWGANQGSPLILLKRGDNMSKVRDNLIGKTFTRLKVLDYAEPDKEGRTQYLCECQCEAKTKLIVPAKRLKSGNTKSCGCLKREKLAARNMKHGYKEYAAYPIYKELARHPENLSDEWKPKDGSVDGINEFFKFVKKSGFEKDDHVSIRKLDQNLPHGPDNSILFATEKRNVTRTSSHNPTDLTGRTFGRLKVLGYGESRERRDGQKYRLWRCECQCPKKTVLLVPTDKLLNGAKSDCGCVREEKILNNEYKPKAFRDSMADYEPYSKLNVTERHKIHRRLYGIWKMMHERCENPNHNKYDIYGGKGVRVCAEWSDKDVGFSNFIKWSLSNGYDDELTIDRIDSDKGYSPDNCRWITYQKQGSHTSRNRYIHDGKEWLTFSEFERKYSIDIGTISHRLASGWSIDAIVERYAHKPDIILKNGQYRNSRGFMVLIPRIIQNEFDDKIKYKEYSDQM